MDTIRINPLIVSVSPTDHTLISPIEPTMHKGGIGKLLGVVAAVTIPFAAPAIASAVAASGALGTAITAAMTTSVGGVISSAIAGAALGAVSAAVTGQSISRGALVGGIGGGFGGYMEGVSAGGSQLGAQSTSGFAGGSPEAIAKLSTEAGTATGMSGGIARGAQVGTQSTTNLSLGETLKQTSDKVWSKMKSPENLANITMHAASSLAGELLVPEGTLAQLSPEEQALIEERKAELVALRDRDLEKYNQAIEISKQYMVQAGQIDPTYFANQEMAKSKIGSARTIRDIEEKAALDDKTISSGDTVSSGTPFGTSVWADKP